MDVRLSYIGCLLVALLLVFSPACTSEEQYEGTYEAQAAEDSKYAGTIIELKEGGQGTWTMMDDEASFEWYVKGDELRLNTKMGGVIVGHLRDDGSFEIELPGAGKMSFQKGE
jgi:hypothetical protein